MSLQKKERNRKGRSCLYIGLGAMVLALLFFLGMMRIEAKGKEEEATGRVYVTVKNLPKGKKLSKEVWEEYTEVREVAQALLPEDAIPEGEEVKGEVAISIGSNTVVTRQMIGQEGQEILGMKKPVMAAVIPSDAASCVGGALKKGDCVTLYFYKEGEEIGRMERLTVAEVFDVTGNRIGEDEEERSVNRFNIYLEEEQAPEFYRLSENGEIRGIRYEK